MEELGWFLATIAVPVFSPFVVLGVFRAASNNLPVSVEKRARPHSLVKDGQLCWVALAMGATCVFEISATSPRPMWSTAVQTVVWTLIVLAAVAATTGVLYPSKPGSPTRSGWWPWFAHHRQLIVSSLILTVTAGSYTWVHVALSKA